MKLIAIRVAAFCRFAEPIAVEGLGDGINVLAGPNEMGKSTLFHALEAVFLSRYKVSGAALEAMRPHAGGEPLVEVEFETEGRRWSIRKQFGRGAGAVLKDIASGKVVARNAEAEERLASLLGRSGDVPGSLGLVWVRQQRSLQPPDPDMESGKEKARGERAVLRDVIGREIAAAAAGSAFESVLERAKRALDELLTPTRNAPRKNGPLERALAFRTEARTKLDAAKNAAAAAEQRLARIASMSERLAELQTGSAAQALSSRVADLEALRAQAAEARTRRDLARETMNAREAQLKAVREIAASRQNLVETITAKRSAHVAVERFGAAIEALVSQINADLATPAVVERLSVLERTRGLAEAELAGHAAYVDVELQESGNGKLTIAGVPLGESRRLTVVEPLQIGIEGIGAITVSTANAVRGSELKLKSASAAGEIEEVLRRLGVASLAEARERAAARAAKVAKLDEARARLSQVAPEGPGMLADELAGLEAALKNADRHKIADEDAARLQSEAAEARANFDAINARAVADSDFRALEAELSEARRSRKSLDDEIGRLTLELAREQGEQAGIDESGRAAEVASTQGDFERADEDASRLQHEADALQLLESTLAEIEAGAKAAYFEPISRRLQPCLQRVFGASELTFKNEFALDAFERGGVREDVALLSDGTREQLGILVRLTFAEVLSQGGNPVPLVLDDPLAYSDDGRLAAVCRELDSAKDVCQIVLLTCREKAFSVLPGRRLSVTDWRPGKNE